MLWEQEKIYKKKDTIINYKKFICEVIADQIIEKQELFTMGNQIKKSIVVNLMECEESFSKFKGKFKSEITTVSKKLNSKPNLQKTVCSIGDYQLIYYHTKDIELRFITSVQSVIEEFDEQTLRLLNTHKGDVNDYDEDNRQEHKKREYFFRGHENFEFGCTPSILREKNFFEHEDELYNELQTLSPKNFFDKKKHLEILTEMQHFSLPTRLLDVSSNPLSALFFSVFSTDESTKHTDGEVIVFDVMRKKVKKFSSDIVEIQTSLAYMPKHKKNNIQKEAMCVISENLSKMERIKKFNEIEEVRQLIHEASKSGVFYQNVLDPEDLFNMYFCLPLKNNERISSQSGAFISYGFLSKKSKYDQAKKVRKYEYDQAGKVQEDYENKVSNSFITTKKDDGDSVRLRYIVPYQCKKHIQNQLESLGINQGNIYPDIDKRSGFIKEKYRNI